MSNVQRPVRNSITEITRRKLFDELRLAKVNWNGRLSEADFLSRIFDLAQLPSNDHRCSNMAGDINMHCVNFAGDWNDDWVFDDSRLNLLRAPDDLFLCFLCQMVHPIVRSAEKESVALVATFNRHIASDGFEVAPLTYVSKRATYSGRPRLPFPQARTVEARRVADELSSDQVAAQITRMETSVETDPALAIGSAKEFVETLCKGILSAKGEALTGGENLPQLVKRTRDALDLAVDRQTEETLKRTLGALASIAQGIAELRGRLGSGHGHHPAAGRPSTAAARLAVGSAITLGVFLYDVFRQGAVNQTE